MKRFFLLFAVLPLFASAQLADDFSDGNFNGWSGDILQFQVNTSNQLQLNSGGTDTSYLSVANSLADSTEWKFWIKLAFSPSANNYARVYLVSDKSALKDTLNGYFLQFGESLSNDAIELFRQTGSTVTSVCRGTDASLANAFEWRVKVTRNLNGLWSIYADTTGGTDFKLQANGTDNTYHTASSFGVLCKYTSSNATKFYFDNFLVQPITVDTVPPDTIPVNTFDVVINEIMADPDPPVKLPNYEYVELFNRTSSPVNLNKWTITLGTSVKAFPDVTIAPDSFLILTSSEAQPYFVFYGQVVGFSSFSVTNTGQTITLKDAEGRIISSVSFTDDWYKNDIKKNGGWSLEQIDVLNPCAGSNNWKASKDMNGGTPGKTNSICASNPDKVMPKLIRAIVLNDTTVKIFFSEPLDSVRLNNPTNYSIDNGIGIPNNLSLVPPDYSSVVLHLSSSIQPKIVYTLTITDTITDCVGNRVELNSKVRFAIPEAAEAMDIVINEVLSNPKDDGVDFVEIYNRSDKVIDLKYMILSSMDEVTSALTSMQQINKEGFLIFPREYYVLTTNPDKVKSQYYTSNPEGFIEMETLPSYNDDEGIVVIADINETIIDKLTYSADMHFPLLNSTEGISLERINFDNPTEDKTNWHSAAESVGFATPAYINSQYSDGSSGDKSITVTPEIFSPDNDGYNDVLSINYQFDKGGYVANVSIFDANGRLVRNLIKNELLENSGTFTWDGINEDNEKAPIGIYIIYIEIFNADGKVKHYKKTAILAAKL